MLPLTYAFLAAAMIHRLETLPSSTVRVVVGRLATARENDGWS